MTEGLQPITPEDLDEIVNATPQLERAHFTRALIKAFRDSAGDMYSGGWYHRGRGDGINEGLSVLAAPNCPAECHLDLEVILGGTRVDDRSFFQTPSGVAALLKVRPLALRQLGTREISRYDNLAEVYSEDFIRVGTGVIRIDSILKLFFPLSPSRRWLLDFLFQLQQAAANIDPDKVDTNLGRDIRMI